LAVTEELVQNKIRSVNRDRHPHTVRELAAMVEAGNPKFSEEMILKQIRLMAESGQLVLAQPPSRSFPHFWVDFDSNLDFWLIIFLSTLGFFTVLVPLVFPWTVVRLLFVLPVMFYFPGHSLLQILAYRPRLTLLERVLLEFASSIVIIMLLGLVLNFSLLGFYALPSVSIIILANLILGFIASYRTYTMNQRNNVKN
jgi:hypothetical protein